MAGFFTPEDQAERHRRSASPTPSPAITSLVVEAMLQAVKDRYRSNASSPLEVAFSEYTCADVAKSGDLGNEWYSYDPEWSFRLWAREVERLARDRSGLGTKLTVDYKDREAWSSGGGRDSGTHPSTLIMKVRVHN